MVASPPPVQQVPLKRFAHLKRRLPVPLTVLVTALLALTVGEVILSQASRPMVGGALNGAEAAVLAMMVAIGYRLGQRSLLHRLDRIIALVLFWVVGPMQGSILLAMPLAVAVGYLVRSCGWMA